MQWDGSDSSVSSFAGNITSVFTYKGIGEQLADLLDNKELELNTTITPGETVTKQFQNMNRTSVLFVSISFIILMIISLVWLVFYYVQRFRYLQSKDKQSVSRVLVAGTGVLGSNARLCHFQRRLCNVAKRIIAKIPTKVVRTEDKVSESGGSGLESGHTLICSGFPQELQNECCPICIEQYRVSDLIRVLPCK